MLNRNDKAKALRPITFCPPNFLIFAHLLLRISVMHFASPERVSLDAPSYQSVGGVILCTGWRSIPHRAAHVQASDFCDVRRGARRRRLLLAAESARHRRPGCRDDRR